MCCKYAVLRCSLNSPGSAIVGCCQWVPHTFKDCELAEDAMASRERGNRIARRTPNLEPFEPKSAGDAGTCVLTPDGLHCTKALWRRCVNSREASYRTTWEYNKEPRLMGEHVLMTRLFINNLTL